MAVKVINQTDTLETFRTTFNDLAANDFGDKANLSSDISATNLIDAMNETISIATSTAGWTIEDSSSSRQIIGGGNVLRVLGSANEIDAVVSATDTLTLGLPNDVTIANDLTVTNSIGVGTITISNNDITDSTGTIQFADDNLETTGTITGSGFTATGGTSTFGTVQISGNEIRSTDSTRVVVNDTLRATSLETSTGHYHSGKFTFGESEYIKNYQDDWWHFYGYISTYQVYDKVLNEFNITNWYNYLNDDNIEIYPTPLPSGANPTISLVNNSYILLLVGQPYTEYGAYATNNTGLNISDDIVITSNVDIQNKGIYTVSYSITDRLGKQSTVDRTVQVVNSPGSSNDDLKVAVNLWTSNKDYAVSVFGEINTWDTSLITNMSELFYNKTNFNEDISNWNVSSVTNMNAMFKNASVFNQDEL